MPRPPLRVAFLGCGFITRVHSRHLQLSPGRHRLRLRQPRRGQGRGATAAVIGGAGSYGDYAAAIDDPRIDAVVIAVPPRFHLELTLQALAAGKHVLVEKPAFLRMEDYEAVVEARNRGGARRARRRKRSLQAAGGRLRALLADGCDRRDGLRALHDASQAAQDRRRLAQRRGDGRAGTRFSKKASTGCTWRAASARRSPRFRAIGRRCRARAQTRRAKSMMVAFRYDNDAVGSLYYSREIPSLLRGLRLSKLFGREGHHHVRVERRVRPRPRTGLPRLVFPGFRDIRGYQAMYRDFVRAIREGRAPEMSLERAIDDQRLMDQIYASVHSTPDDANATTSSSSAAAPAAGRWRTRWRRRQPAS